jgi:hypothetical protein
LSSNKHTIDWMNSTIVHVSNKWSCKFIYWLKMTHILIDYDLVKVMFNVAQFFFSSSFSRQDFLLELKCRRLYTHAATWLWIYSNWSCTVFAWSKKKHKKEKLKFISASAKNGSLLVVGTTHNLYHTCD